MEFERRQLDLAAAHGDLVAALVYDEVADLQAVSLLVLRLRPLARAPQQRLHPHLKLARAEGLRQVVVRARLEARDLVVHGVVRGQKQCGRLDAAVAHAFQEFEAGHAVHRHVEDEAVEAARHCRVERVLGALLLHDLVAQPPEIFREQHAHAQVVVNNQNPKAHTCHLESCRG